MKLVIIISMIYLTVFIDPGTCLKCYSCSSYRYLGAVDKCKDPFFKNDSLIIDCDPKYDVCFRSAAKDIDEIIKFRRDCGNKSEIQDILNGNTSIGSKAEIIFLDHCKADICNGSLSQKSSAVVTILIVMFKFFFNRLC